MFTAETMTLGESLIISALGIATVFTCLIVLSLAILLFSRLLSHAGNEKKAPVPAAPVAPAFDEESYAVIMAAVSEETGLPLDKFQITSIKEL